VTPGSIVPEVLVVMGVSGSGKTTVATLLAERLGWPFAEGDDFHPPANVAKMQGGTPLTDADRMPWLQAIAGWIDARRATASGGIVSCSALKRAYRKILIGERRDVRLIYVRGSQALIGARIAARHDHFMPASLLQSQFDTLEEPAADERPIIADAALTPAAMVEQVLAGLDARESSASR
jgi:carbohydrate kinase (thermoresistant glucokinase family)